MQSYSINSSVSDSQILSELPKNFANILFTNASLGAGWSNYGQFDAGGGLVLDYAPARYRKLPNGLLEIGGLIKKSTSPVTTETIIQLPIPCHPDKTLVISGKRTFDGSTSTNSGEYHIHTDGRLLFIGGAASGFYSLEAIIGITRRTALFIGDSNTVGSYPGSSVSATQRFSYLVSQELGMLEFNQAISATVLQNAGGLSLNGFDRWQSAVLSQYANLLVIAYGTNDMRSSNSALTVGNYENQLDSMVKQAFNYGYLAGNIIICTPPFLTLYQDGGSWNTGSFAKHMQYVNSCYTVAKNNKVKLADNYLSTLNAGGVTQLQSDGLHLNTAGHATCAATILNARFI
jgi:lysophospholipase L1-like esterase